MGASRRDLIVVIPQGTAVLIRARPGTPLPGQGGLAGDLGEAFVQGAGGWATCTPFGQMAAVVRLGRTHSSSSARCIPQTAY